MGAGTEVSLTTKEGGLVLRPFVPSRFRLTDLLAGVTPEKIHASVGTGDAVGTEAFRCRPTWPIVVVWCGWSAHHKSEVNSVEEGPALVLSPKSYNGKVGLVLCCPVMSKIKGYPFEDELH